MNWEDVNGIILFMDHSRQHSLFPDKSQDKHLEDQYSVFGMFSEFLRCRWLWLFFLQTVCRKLTINVRLWTLKLTNVAIEKQTSSFSSIQGAPHYLSLIWKVLSFTLHKSFDSKVFYSKIFPCQIPMNNFPMAIFIGAEHSSAWKMVIQFAHLFLGKIPAQQIFCHAKMSFPWKLLLNFNSTKHWDFSYICLLLLK